MQSPRSIKRIDSGGLEITWHDGVVDYISSAALRQHCPSAVSKAQRGDTSHDKPLQIQKRSGLRVVQHSLQEQLNITRITGVGNYAIKILWEDGHNSGIYSFDFLKKLSLIEAQGD